MPAARPSSFMLTMQMPVLVSGIPTALTEMCKQGLLKGQNFMDRGGGRLGWKRGQGRQCNYWILDIYRVECTKCIGWCISMYLGKVYPRNWDDVN